jgi:hypothetical protein
VGELGPEGPLDPPPHAAARAPRRMVGRRFVIFGIFRIAREIDGHVGRAGSILPPSLRSRVLFFFQETNG